MQNVEFQYVTKGDLKQFGIEIAQAMAKANAGILKKMDALRAELGEAQNQTAAIVDEDRQLLEAVMFNLRFVLEKLGALNEDGTETPEIQEWKARRISEAQAMAEAAKGETN